MGTPVSVSASASAVVAALLAANVVNGRRENLVEVTTPEVALVLVLVLVDDDDDDDDRPANLLLNDEGTTQRHRLAVGCNTKEETATPFVTTAAAKQDK